jgi:hypothetical protein
MKWILRKYQVVVCDKLGGRDTETLMMICHGVFIAYVRVVARVRAMKMVDVLTVDEWGKGQF